MSSTYRLFCILKRKGNAARLPCNESACQDERHKMSRLCFLHPKADICNKPGSIIVCNCMGPMYLRQP